jgi:sec-independent protein translocase protein TatB
MDIFGIGPTELVFIILIALIVLGPKDMEKTARTIGRWLRDLTTSDGWRAFRDTSREIRNLPNRLMREANLEDLEKDMNKIGKDVAKVGKDVDKVGKEIKDAADVKGFGTWANPAAAKSKPSQPKPAPAEEPDHIIASPSMTAPPEQEKVEENNKETDKDA